MTNLTRRVSRIQGATTAVVLAGLALLGCSTDDEPDAQPPVEDGTSEDGTGDGGEDDPMTDDPNGDDDQQEPDDGTNGNGASPDDNDDGEDGDPTDDDPAAGDTEDPEPIAASGDTDPDETEGESAGLDDDGNLRPQAVTDVRVGSHDGFDRVVFELESDGGTPGWFVEYGEPTAQGSGNEVEVAGDATLNVLINPVTLPPDLPDDVQTFEGDLDGAEDGIVQQVVNGTVYEGYHQFFIGVDEERPFAVERLQDPPRVVIDIFDEQD